MNNLWLTSIKVGFEFLNIQRENLAGGKEMIPINTRNMRHCVRQFPPLHTMVPGSFLLIPFTLSNMTPIYQLRKVGIEQLLLQVVGKTKNV